jgi:hypothetical protein
MSTTVAFVRMAGSSCATRRSARDRADHRRRGAHLRHGGPLPPDRHLLAHRPVVRAEDAAQLSYYKEAVEGQILEEGINEAGALASWLAAATSYSAHGLAMLPMYIYYSIFGFQRVGDIIWAAADSRARGFLFGATAGRTTLSGEGCSTRTGRATSSRPRSRTAALTIRASPTSSR